MTLSVFLPLSDAKPSRFASEEINNFFLPHPRHHMGEICAPKDQVNHNSEFALRYNTSEKERIISLQVILHLAFSASELLMFFFLEPKIDAGQTRSRFISDE